MSQSICIISTQAPYRGQFAREALDAALVSASYEIPTSLLLMGDGVYQILDGQSPGQLEKKKLSSLFQSLELYGIETVYVDGESLAERHLDPEQLLPLYTLLEGDAVASFLAQQDKVLSF
ncbi:MULTISPECIES: sulfurtransferase complex subunit TusC [unclassified Endozoicomonas]|uniref:sulfurtransferase complex subunit TusC n=1 Tax=unclassified Endozoicomonas TaxID=2644528 RepID=UPI0021485AC9|nr:MULTISPECIES: sulfurtransferase complex subunit TusC [unclassified Endozoicomonas]